MIKGAHREPYSLVEAHRPRSSEQWRTGNGECFPLGRHSSPFHRLPRMNFPTSQGSVQCREGKRVHQGPEFQLYLGVWFWVSHCTPLNHSVLTGDHTLTLKPPCPASIILPLPLTPSPSWVIQEVPKTNVGLGNMGVFFLLPPYCSTKVCLFLESHSAFMRG